MNSVVDGPEFSYNLTWLLQKYSDLTETDQVNQEEPLRNLDKVLEIDADTNELDGALRLLGRLPYEIAHIIFTHVPVIHLVGLYQADVEISGQKLSEIWKEREVLYHGLDITIPYLHQDIIDKLEGNILPQPIETCNNLLHELMQCIYHDLDDLVVQYSIEFMESRNEVLSVKYYKPSYDVQRIGGILILNIVNNQPQFQMLNTARSAFPLMNFRRRENEDIEQARYSLFYDKTENRLYKLECRQDFHLCCYMIPALGQMEWTTLFGRGFERLDALENLGITAHGEHVFMQFTWSDSTMLIHYNRETQQRRQVPFEGRFKGMLQHRKGLLIHTEFFLIYYDVEAERETWRKLLHYGCAQLDESTFVFGAGECVMFAQLEQDELRLQESGITTTVDGDFQSLRRHSNNIFVLTRRCGSDTHYFYETFNGRITCNKIAIQSGNKD